MQNKKPKKIPKFYLKDRLFNRGKVEKIAEELAVGFKFFKKDFAKQKFTEDVLEKFPELELKQRIFHITETLYKYFKIANLDYLESLEIILKALPNELDDSLSDGDFGDFIYSPYGEYVAKYGLEKKYLKNSLNTLEEITKRFSVEFPIRDFWNTHEKEVFDKFLKWSKSKNYHVRRLASEGARPRLPWGKKINLHYLQTEKILDNLFLDKTRYVTRSVANHLNDISKIDKDFVLRKLIEWEKENTIHKMQTEKEMEFIKKHATRTLRKKENL
jgi:3-methyladenine DNA glycosylase AlkC